MQTILVPTDFKSSALDCVPALCSQLGNNGIGFIFMHMFKLSDSEGELLMLSKRNREYEQVSDEFYTQCARLKQQYPQIRFIKIEFLYGSTLSMFKNFLEAHGVDLVLDTTHQPVQKIHKASIDPAVLIQRSGLPVLRLEKRAATQPDKAEEVSKLVLAEA